ncbi:MAG: TonB-dependent receptor [Rubrivivax sp.]
MTHPPFRRATDPVRLAALCACALGSLNAWAQASDPRALQTVEITAQKRTQNLQVVPVSVESVSSADLERSGVKDLFNLGDLSPSVTGGQANRTLGARMGVRGISDFARNPGYDASMGVYVDGVYAGRTEATSQGLTGIERVEILRGPQGTLFGKNTVAGALNLTTRKPTDRFEASASAEAGGSGTRNLGLWLGGAAVPGTLQLALTLGQEKSDGWVDNLTQPGARPGSGTGESARALARLKLGAGGRVDLAAWRYRYEGVPAYGEAVAPSALANLAPGPRTTATDAPSQETIRKDGGSVTVEWGLPGGLQLTSISATQKARNSYVNDDDMAPQDIVVAPGTFNSSRQVSQELRLASASRQDLDWLVGLFYMTQDNEQTSAVRTGTAFPVAALRGLTSTSVGALESSTLALFAHGNVMLTPTLQFTGGLRSTRETKDATLAQNPVPGLTANIPRFSGSVTDHDVSPKLGLNWFVQPALMLYGSYTQGFKSGGYNMDVIGAAVVSNPADDLRFGKQKVKSVELGWKAELLDRAMRVNGSVYRMDGTDWQVQQFVPQANGTNVSTITNAGEVRIDGAEVDLQAKVSPTLTVKGGMAYTDAVFVSFKNAGGVGIHHDGNRLPFAPRLKTSLSVEHVLPLGPVQLRSSLGFTHTDLQYSNSNNTAVNTVPRVDLVNARVAVEGGETRRWTAALWVRNLTDRTYTTFNGTNGLQQARAIYGAPRTVGVQVALDL